jgi:hypothetical protein
MGADASVVRSTQRTLSLTQNLMAWPQYSAYAAGSYAYCMADMACMCNVIFMSIVNSWGSKMATTLYGGLFSLLTTFDYGRSMLLAHPETFTGGVFSHTGPSDEQLQETSFKMTFFAQGFSEISAAQTGIAWTLMPAASLYLLHNICSN